MSGILFLVQKFCNVEIMPMVVVGRWWHKGGPHEPHPIFIFQTIFMSNLITMIKKGNLGNQWQSLISSPVEFPEPSSATCLFYIGRCSVYVPCDHHFTIFSLLGEKSKGRAYLFTKKNNHDGKCFIYHLQNLSRQ